MKTMLFNPYTGKPRDPRDIASDPAGTLMVDPDEPLLAAPAAAEAAALPLVRFAARWHIWARAMAEASACQHSVGSHPFFQALEQVAGTKLRRFTPEEFGSWVDQAGEAWKASTAGTGAQSQPGC